MESLSPSERAAVIVAVRRFLEASWAATDDPASEPAKRVRLVELADLVFPDGSSARVDILVGELVGALFTAMEWLTPHVVEQARQRVPGAAIGSAGASGSQFLIELLFVMNRARELQLEPDPAQRLVRLGEMQSAGIVSAEDARTLVSML